MWWSRRLVLLLGLLGLGALQAGCGFQPVYGGGQNGGAGGELRHVAVATVPDRVGHRLRAELDRLFANEGQQQRYRLNIDLAERSTVTAIDRDDSVRRRNLRLVAAIALVPEGADKPVLTRTVVSDAGVDQLPSDFATLVAEDAAEQRAVERLAREIRRVLAVHFARQG